MHCGLASVALDYCSGIGDMIKMTMGKQQQT